MAQNYGHKECIKAHWLPYISTHQKKEHEASAQQALFVKLFICFAGAIYRNRMENPFACYTLIKDEKGCSRLSSPSTAAGSKMSLSNYGILFRKLFLLWLGYFESFFPGRCQIPQGIRWSWRKVFHSPWAAFWELLGGEMECVVRNQ